MDKLLKFVKKLFLKGFRLLWANLPLVFGAGLLLVGAAALWATTLKLPSLDSADNIRVVESTKIYDRTGEIVLFDLHKTFRRTSIEEVEMSPFVRMATVAIEDENFYNHKGIQPTSIIRAIIKNLLSLGYTQGGSTITQQVIKNALLTNEKTLTRKFKEWVLAIKLEKILGKEDILTMYLNTVPYGGNVYGVEEASRVFFGKQAKSLSLSEAAYIAALPQAPTYYSPFGSHRDALEDRKNLVLKQMFRNNKITEAEYNQAVKDKVTFIRQDDSSIKAPHFVMFVREKLAEILGEEALDEGGYKVITTLDYPLQQKAEEVVKKWALLNKQRFNAENAGMVAIDPQTGDVLVMVGSRDYFDKEIDGNYNIATALRQPGSSFKPIVYAASFLRGLRPETVVWDVPTEFSTSCGDNEENCYNPENYDGKFRGPISLRNALAQSINVPAVKVLYITGINNAMNLAEKMGITTLNDPSRFGLSLVLGGGEIKLVDLTSAYGVFAAEGKRAPYQTILKIEDKNGKMVLENKPELEEVLDKNVALRISSILSDEQARIPTFGAGSPLHFPGKSVAVKTGTTNDYRDTWIIGYTPYIAVGSWAGNNDNSSIDKSVAGFVVAPMWNDFMKQVLADHDEVPFEYPEQQDDNVKPIIKGFLTGNHDILHWVDRNDILGDPPRRPTRDPQYLLWEEGVEEWLQSNSSPLQPGVNNDTNGTNSGNSPIIILSPSQNQSYSKEVQLPITLGLPPGFIVSKADVFLNSKFIGSFNKSPLVFSFVPDDVNNLKNTNNLTVSVYDIFGKKYEASTKLQISDN